MALSGDWALVCSPTATNAAGAQVGAAYMFRWDGTNWTQTQKLTASDVSPNDPFRFPFGCAAALSGDWAMVGAPHTTNAAGVKIGAVYVFR